MKVASALTGSRAAAAEDVKTTVNTAMPVGSLKTDSISTRAASFGGTFTRAKTSRTVATSVGEISAAKRKDTSGDSPTTFHRTTPTTRTEIRTPAVAMTKAGL